VKLDQASAISPKTELVDVAQSARLRIAVRLLPFLFVLYIIAFLDRMNVGAAALQMPGDLSFSDRAMGLGAGIFFLGYFLLQIPGALIAERYSARRWIAAVMIVWGVLTVLMAFIRTQREFYAVRFVVGAAEAGFFPAAVVYLTHWFRSMDRAKAVGAFYAAMPLSYVIGSPLAGLLLGLSWLGLRGWRWLFILEGLPAVLMGLIALIYLTDWPWQANWLRPDEREWITTALDRERKTKQQVRSYSIWQAVRHPDVILLAGCYFFALTGNYGIAFWLPTILKRLSGQTNLRVMLLASLPYFAGFISQQVNGWHSDRWRERRWHAAVPILLSGLALFFAIISGPHVALSIIFFSLMGGAYYAFHPAFWAMPT
jgi:ACS family tartrate transporter-like MFS transporter